MRSGYGESHGRRSRPTPQGVALERPGGGQALLSLMGSDGSQGPSCGRWAQVGSLTLASLLPPVSLSSALDSGFFQSTPRLCPCWFLLWENLFPTKSLGSHFHALKMLLTPVFSEKPLKATPSEIVLSQGVCHIGWLILLPVSGSHEGRPALSWYLLNPVGWSWC